MSLECFFLIRETLRIQRKYNKFLSESKRINDIYNHHHHHHHQYHHHKALNSTDIYVISCSICSRVVIFKQTSKSNSFGSSRLIKLTVSLRCPAKAHKSQVKQRERRHTSNLRICDRVKAIAQIETWRCTSENRESGSLACGSISKYLNTEH